MAETRAYYGAIQYSPHPSGTEAANVGIVLFCPDPHGLYVRTSPSLVKVRRFFRPDPLAMKHIERAVRAVAVRLTCRKEDFRTLDDLEAYAGSLGNDVQISPLRVTILRDPEQDMARLYHELVEPAAEKKGRPTFVLPPSLNDAFVKLAAENRIFKPGPIALPMIRHKLRFPYAYQNGALNLIQPMVLESSSASEKKAMQVAAEGDLIQTNAIGRLIVVSDANNQPEAEERLAPLFEHFHVTLVRQREADAFAAQVLREAK